MDALQKVFDTIMKVLTIIKDFFAQLGLNFGDDAEGEGEGTDAPAEA